VGRSLFARKKKEDEEVSGCGEGEVVMKSPLGASLKMIVAETALVALEVLFD
jgi:hypothetical protein